MKLEFLNRNVTHKKNTSRQTIPKTLSVSFCPSFILWLHSLIYFYLFPYPPISLYTSFSVVHILPTKAPLLIFKNDFNPTLHCWHVWISHNIKENKYICNGSPVFKRKKCYKLTSCTASLFSLCKILKKILEWIQSYEGAQFLGPNWSICLEQIFFRKNY